MFCIYKIENRMKFYAIVKKSDLTLDNRAKV